MFTLRYQGKMRKWRGEKLYETEKKHGKSNCCIYKLFNNKKEKIFSACKNMNESSKCCAKQK